MKFGDYKKRMNLIGKVINVLYRFRIPIISGIVLITASALVLTGISGLAQGVSLDDNSFKYGEDVSAYGKSTFGSADLEFSPKNQNKWTKEVPVRAGEYDVRAYSVNGFGQETYSKPQSFSIAPLDLEIKNVNTQLTYGDDINFVASNLVLGDRLETIDVTFGEEFNEFNPFGEGDRFDTTYTIDLSKTKIYNTKNEDVTYCYNIPNKPVDITIKKRPLDIIVKQNKKDYDGDPLSTEGNTYVSDTTPLAEGDETRIVYNTSIKDVGKIDISDIVNVYNGDIDRTNFYDISYNVNSLEITKRDLTITTNSISRDYNGQILSKDATQSDNQLTYTLSNTLAKGHEFVFISFGSEGAYKPVSGSMNTLNYCIIDEEGNDVTKSHYYIKEDFGLINISKRQLDISYKQVNPETFNYQTLTGGYILNSEIAPTDALSHTLKDGHFDTLSSIDHIFYEYDFSVFNNHLGVDVTSDCYNITINGIGELHIKAAPLKIWSNDLTKTYDGIAYSSEENTEDNSKLVGYSEGLLNGHTIEFNFGYSGSLFVNGDNSFTYSILDQNNNDVSWCYEPSVRYGKITTKKRDLKYKFSSNKWVYDGKSHSDTNIIDTSGNGDFNLASGDDIRVLEDTFSNIMNYGQIDNHGSVRVYHNFEDRTAYYSLPSYEESKGNLSITKRPIEITYNVPESKLYDGQKILIDQSDVSVSNLPDNHSCIFVLNYDEIFLSGNYDIQISDLKIFNNLDENVTSNFDIYYENNLHVFRENIDDEPTPLTLGRVEISKRSLNLSTYSKEKIYDGENLDSYDAIPDGHTEVYVINECDGLLPQETIQVDSVSHVNNVGTTTNNISIRVSNPVLGDVTSCYDITYNPGELSVIPAEVEIEFPNNSPFLYDSHNHTLNSTNMQVRGLVSGHRIQLNKKSFVEVGEYPLADTFTYKIYDSNNDDVTNNYKSLSIIGSPLVILKAPLQINMLNIHITLDNQVLPNIKDITVVSGLGYNDKLNISFEKDALTKVKNEIFPVVNYDVIRKSTGKSSMSNYDVTYIPGIASFDKTQITIGFYHEMYTLDYLDTIIDVNNNYKLQPSTTKLPENYYYEGIEIAADRTVRDVGVYQLSMVNIENIEIYKIESGEKVYVTDNFNINITNTTAQLEIKKMKLTFDKCSNEYIYDGDIKCIKPVSGRFVNTRHHAEIKDHVLAIDVGVYYYKVSSVEDIIIKDYYGNDVTYMYEIFVTEQLTNDGFDVTINKSAFTVYTPYVSKYFDGSQISKDDFKEKPPFNVKVEAEDEHDIPIYPFDPMRFGIDKNRIVLSFPILPTDFIAYKKSYSLEVKVYDSSDKDVSHNYDIEVVPNFIEIKPIEIYYSTSHSNTTYNGQSYDTQQNLLNDQSVNDIVTVNLNQLPEEVFKYITNNYDCAYSYVDTSNFMVGTYSETPKFVILYKGYNLIDTGSIIMVSTNGDYRFTINQARLTITNKSQDIIISRRNPKASEELFVSNLVSGDTIYINDEQYQAGKEDYGFFDMKDGSPEGIVYGSDFFNQYINISTIRIVRYVDGNYVDVTHCYNINFVWYDIIVRTLS